ncbi:MAG: hypothetical protein J7527_14920, partial [Chitinophagaceae bacterium]|nr:hypothetical protein [Chitinophagaceae bacterium]
MNSKSTVTTHQPVFGTVLSITFGIATSIAGLINTFWGNDTIFGLFLITLSFAYFPFSNRLFTRITGIVLP